MKILGYENITVLSRYEMEEDKSILLYEDDTKKINKYGILFEEKYNSDTNYDKVRNGAFNYETLKEAINEFTSRINWFLSYTMIFQNSKQ